MKVRENKLSTFAQIRELSPPKDIVFGCALMQRMLPNYRLFCESTGFGDPDLAQSVLNLVWEWCMSGQNKFNAGVQLEKFEEIILQSCTSIFDHAHIRPSKFEKLSC